MEKNKCGKSRRENHSGKIDKEKKQKGIFSIVNIPLFLISFG